MLNSQRERERGREASKRELNNESEHLTMHFTLSPSLPCPALLSLLPWHSSSRCCCVALSSPMGIANLFATLVACLTSCCPTTVSPSLCPFVCPSICPFVCLSVRSSVCCPSPPQSICQFGASFVDFIQFCGTFDLYFCFASHSLLPFPLPLFPHPLRVPLPIVVIIMSFDSGEGGGSTPHANWQLVRNVQLEAR